MDIFDAVSSRYSCRAFLPKAVPEAVVRDIVKRAARAPSAGNMQPWRVYALAGKRVEALKAQLRPNSHRNVSHSCVVSIFSKPSGLNVPAMRSSLIVSSFTLPACSNFLNSLYGKTPEPGMPALMA